MTRASFSDGILQVRIAIRNRSEGEEGTSVPLPSADFRLVDGAGVTTVPVGVGFSRSWPTPGSGTSFQTGTPLRPGETVAHVAKFRVMGDASHLTIIYKPVSDRPLTVVTFRIK